jgi:hypothetical protein
MSSADLTLHDITLDDFGSKDAPNLLCLDLHVW